MNKDTAYDVSIVIPCYQDEWHIVKSVKEISSVMKTTPYKFEMIFVDDASADKTKEMILYIEQNFPDVRYVMHEKNTGRGRAFCDGAKIAKGNYVGFLDIDLEVSASYLPEVLKKLDEGNHVVIVNRSYRIVPTFSFLIRQFSSVFYKKLASAVFHIPPLDTESGFKFFKRESLFALLPQVRSDRWFFDTEIMVLAHLAGQKITQVEGIYKRNPEKTSTVRLFADSIDQFSELLKLKRRLKNLSSTKS